MTNVQVTVSPDKKTATIVVDLTKRNGASKTGKTIIVASTNGNQKIAGTDVSLGLNAYIKQ